MKCFLGFALLAVVSFATTKLYTKKLNKPHIVTTNQYSNLVENNETELVIFTKTTCDACTSTKRHLAIEGIKYKEFSIDTSEEAANLFQLNSFKGVPLLITKSQMLLGYNESAVDMIIKEVQ